MTTAKFVPMYDTVTGKATVSPNWLLTLTARFAPRYASGTNKATLKSSWTAALPALPVPILSALNFLSATISSIRYRIQVTF